MILKAYRQPITINNIRISNCNRLLKIFDCFDFLRFILITLFAFSVAGCGSESDHVSSDYDLGNAAKVNAGFTDLKIAQLVYFDNRIPEGFYHEQYSNDAYYVTSHIKNTDLLAIVDRVGVS
ncbi:MAG: hypothetical protein COB77_06205, partial [Gammaproteobacteria bacterium]